MDCGSFRTVCKAAHLYRRKKKLPINRRYTQTRSKRAKICFVSIRQHDAHLNEHERHRIERARGKQSVVATRIVKLSLDSPDVAARLLTRRVRGDSAPRH
jgi:hypothetical protein